MSVALFKILILLIIAIIASGQEHLPQSGQCGTLNTEYYYNLNISTNIGEFPWMGRVQYENKRGAWYQCFTVLISERFSLLNAQCFFYGKQPVRVLFGDWDKGNDDTKSDCDGNGRCAPVPIFYEIEDSFIHPNYSEGEPSNDIALIKTRETIEYSDYIRPICLPRKDVIQLNFTNQLLEVTGWYFTPISNHILGKSFGRVVSLNNCEKMYKDDDIDKEHTICVFTCFFGDYIYFRGAALMDTVVLNESPVNYYLVGLYLFDNAGLSCSSHTPYVYIRVDRYLDWIYENTRYKKPRIPRIYNK